MTGKKCSRKRDKHKLRQKKLELAKERVQVGEQN